MTPSRRHKLIGGAIVAGVVLVLGALVAQGAGLFDRVPTVQPVRAVAKPGPAASPPAARTHPEPGGATVPLACPVTGLTAVPAPMAPVSKQGCCPDEGEAPGTECDHSGGGADGCPEHD